ncbi:MAG: cytochrome c3 family protein, partial [Leptothrix sp. (in: b-proteobacteria)]
SPTWKPTLWNHTQQTVAGQCSTCHSGAFPPADGKPVNHIPYASIAGASSANCDSCHKAGFASWNPGTFHRNFTVSTSCTSCHNSGSLGATQKPNTATHAGVTNCETCHTVTNWTTTGKPNHATFTPATNCSSCHNGSTAPGKTTTHIPTSANCVTCHTATAATWKPTLWNHTQQVVASQCSSCHSGAYPPADGKPVNHIPLGSVAGASSANCDACHKSGYVSWNPGKFHTSFTVVTGCASCHMTASYLGPTQTRPNTAIHANATTCESCHKSTTSWTANTKVDHTTFTAATNCSSCHNGTTATGKATSHMPVGATNCFSCHNTSGWTPTKWNHTQVTVAGQCSTCHSGAFPPADAKPATHIPYASVAGLTAANCDTCHKGSFATWANGKLHASATVTGQCKTCHSGSYTSWNALAKPTNHIPEALYLLNGGTMECNACHTSTTVWTSMTMNHNSTPGNGAGSCKGCHATGTAFLGNMQKKAVTHQSKTATDCSQSGCHKPLGNQGTVYRSW